MSFVRTFWEILPARQRSRYLLIQILFLVSGIFQVAGAGSIAPFVALISNPALAHTNAELRSIVDFVGLSGEQEILIAFALATIAILILSNLIAALSNWALFRYSFSLGGDIEQDLLAAYLNYSAEKLSQLNSTTLINAVSQGARRFTYELVLPVLSLSSQLMVVVAVIALLAWYSPAGLLTFAVLTGGGYWLMFYLIRSRLTYHGRRSYATSRQKLRILTESLGSLKEVRLAGTEYQFYDAFAAETRRGQRSDSMLGILGDLPRYLIETIAFTVLLGYAILRIYQGGANAEIVATLSVFAMAGYRLLPAGQTIFRSVSRIRANTHVMEELLPDIRLARKKKCGEAAEEGEATNLHGDICIENLSFAYQGSEKPVLDGIDLTIRRNEITVLAGLSGSGKSTLVDIVIGLLEPQSGKIRIGDHDLSMHRRTWQRQIGYVPQNIFLLDDSISSNIAFGSMKEIDEKRVKRAADLANISGFVAGVPDGFQYRVGERGMLLSGGQRQRIGIARALYNNPTILVLDEATSALDGATEKSIIETLRELKSTITVIMVAHRQATISAADRVVLLNNGHVEASGTYAELESSNELFRKLIIAADEDTP